MKKKLSEKASQLLAVKNAKKLIDALNRGGRSYLAAKLQVALDKDLAQIKEKENSKNECS